MRFQPARRDGLSLLEVLVSLAIFLMSLVALVHLVNTASNLADEGRHRSRAALLARSKMNEFVSGALAMESQSEATFEDETDFRWSADIQPGAASGLYHVTVRVVHRPDDPYPVEVVLSRMTLDPKICGSTQDVPAMPSESSSDSQTESGTSDSGTSGTGTSGSGSGTGGTSTGGMGSGMGSGSGASKGPSSPGGTGGGTGAGKGTGGTAPGAGTGGGARGSGTGPGAGSGTGGGPKGR